MKYFLLNLLLNVLSIHCWEERPHKVEQLTLPSNIEISSEEGFVVIKADCKGSVKWLVLSNEPTKYLVYESYNTLILGVPKSGTITIFAIGLCDGKNTEYAKTVVTVKALKSKLPSAEQKPLKW